MTLDIGAINSSYANWMQAPSGRVGRGQRPDPDQQVEQLFNQLDTSQKGYLDKTDLAGALAQLGSIAGSTSASVDEVFGALDVDSDGRVTQAEMTSGLQSLSQALDDQFNALRTGGGAPPPPPPPQGNDGGLTRDQVEEIATSTTDSRLASLMTQVADNFDQADSDGDGRVTLQEAMTYQAQQTGTTSDTQTLDSAPTRDDATQDARILGTLMALMRAYSTDAMATVGMGVSETA